MSHWFQKFSAFRELPKEERQAFLVSKIIDHHLPKKAIELNKKFKVRMPEGDDFSEFLELVFLYCGSFTGGSSKWEDDVCETGLGYAREHIRKRSTKPLLQKNSMNWSMVFILNQLRESRGMCRVSSHTAFNALIKNSTT